MESSDNFEEREIFRHAIMFGLNIVYLVKYLSDFNDALRAIDNYLSSEE